MSTRNTKNKPKPTMAQIEHYDYLNAEKHRLLKLDYNTIKDELQKVLDERLELAQKYDWFDVVFEENGKKGLKNVKGEIVVPAIYDGFNFTCSYLYPNEYAVARKGDKVGLVECNGKGTPHSAFEFSYIKPIPFLSEVHIACKEGDDKHFALLVGGKEFTPYELTKYYEPCDGYMVVCNEDNKCGFLDLEQLIYVSPEFDDIYDEGEGSDITFVKDGKEGILTYDKKFISKEDYNKMSDDEQDRILDEGYFNVEMLV